jgi:hypothetical protein
MMLSAQIATLSQEPGARSQEPGFRIQNSGFRSTAWGERARRSEKKLNNRIEEEFEYDWRRRMSDTLKQKAGFRKLRWACLDQVIPGGIGERGDSPPLPSRNRSHPRPRTRLGGITEQATLPPTRSPHADTPMRRHADTFLLSPPPRTAAAVRFAVVQRPRPAILPLRFVPDEERSRGWKHCGQNSSRGSRPPWFYPRRQVFA